MVAGIDSDLQTKALLVHERLCAEYDCPFPFFRDVDPLTELIGSLLSHRTKNQDSGRALAALKKKYRRWESVMDAPTNEVIETISAATWPEQKAPRIQGALRQIAEERGELALEFLSTLPVDEARAWLERIPGVGPKTSAAVLVFSTLRMPALPVDSHHHRVATRLGLVPDGMGPGPAHTRLREQLPDDWTTQELYDNHEALMTHGQRCCFYRAPACGRCAVLDLCPYGQARQKEETE